MSLTPHEQNILNSILEWEKQMFKEERSMVTSSFSGNWSKKGFKKINPSIKDKVTQSIDQAIFQLNALLHSVKWQKETQERLIQEAQIFSSDVIQLEDMKHLSLKQLSYMVEKEVSKQRWRGLIQGGVTGSGGFLMLGIDLPLLLAINMRAIQTIAMTYGYNTLMPVEMLTSLKVLQMGILPKTQRGPAWEELGEQVLHRDHDPYFYNGPDSLESEAWFDQLIRQIGKTFLIVQLRKKAVNNIPLLGMALGAGLNYRFTKSITDIAHKFYQKRFILEKEG